jgi:hypothetical protein
MRGKEKYRYKQLQQAALLEMEACSVKKQFTPEKISEWKDLGLTCPEWIPLRDWQMDDTLTPRQLMICKAASLLMTNKEVAEFVGVSSEYVGWVINTQLGHQEVSKNQDKMFHHLEKTLQEITPIAVKTAFKLMLDENTKPQTRIDAAFRFMDRTLGKPTQKLEVETNLIRQVYEKLDANKVVDIAMKRVEAVAIESQVEKEPEKELDPIDSWVKENL